MAVYLTMLQTPQDTQCDHAEDRGTILDCCDGPKA
jgi:hypothetical protein